MHTEGLEDGGPVVGVGTRLDPVTCEVSGRSVPGTRPVEEGGATSLRCLDLEVVSLIKILPYFL